MGNEETSFAAVENYTSIKNNKNYKKPIIIAIIVLAVIIGVVGGYYTYKCVSTVNKYSEKVYPEVKLLDKNLGGLTSEQLHKEIESIVEELCQKDLKVKVNENNYEIAHRAFEVSTSYEELENEIMAYGKDNKFFEKLNLIDEPKEVNFDLELTFNKENINNFASDIEKEVYVEPINASIDIGSGISVTNGVNGSKLNTEELVANIEKIIMDPKSESGVELNASFIDVEPAITTASLASVDTKISTFTTYFPAGPSGENIKLGTKNVDNILLMPGEQFSGIDAIGPTTRELGYKESNTYVDGKIVKNYGGGVCQIITTLYNAQLRAGIKALERTNHMFTVGYIGMGLDATIGDYAPDLLFNNTLEYPVVINAYTTNGSVTIEFWSNSNATNGITYAPSTVSTGSLSADTYLNGYDASGNIISSEYIHSSTYKPFN